VSYTVGSNPNAVAVADFNGDNRADLAVDGGFCHVVSILLGNGDGTFGAATNYSMTAGCGTPGFLNDVAVRDLNGDGRADIVVGVDTGDIVVRLGNGDGTFGGAASFDAGATDSNIQQLIVDDLNLDTRPDVVATNFETDKIAFLPGNGDGTFGAFQTYDVGDGPHGIISSGQGDGDAIPDLNGDMLPDLAVTNRYSNDVSLLFNTSIPHATVSPPSLGFGSQLLYTTSRNQKLTITSTGAAPLRIDDLRILGGNAEDFEIKREACTNNPWPLGFYGGESCPIVIAFTPTAAGARSATLRVLGNTDNTPMNVTLNGTGAVPNCSGLAATIVGTDGADVIQGTAGVDVVALLGGSDTFTDVGGNDLVCGGPGDDDLTGGPGSDILKAKSGDDDVAGSSGNDTVRGGSDDDDLNGGANNDLCAGGSGTDTAAGDCETTNDVP
jgi:Ca2+-binding RTX toxin-like protein